MECTVVEPTSPAFIDLDGRRLLATTLLRGTRTALTLSKHSSPNQVSLHSLWRRGAAAGASLDAVRAVGRWRSGAVYEYTPRRVFTGAPKALSSLFG